MPSLIGLHVIFCQNKFQARYSIELLIAPHASQESQKKTAAPYHTHYLHIYIKSFFGFRDLVRIYFLLSLPKYAIHGTGILGRIALFERRLRGAAPKPLSLPCPFRISTWTRTDAERGQREVAKIPHVEEEFRRFWLNLNVCSAWMIYKICIISKERVLDNVWNFAVAYTTYYCLVTDCAPGV